MPKKNINEINNTTESKLHKTLGFLVFAFGFLIYFNTLHYGYVLDDLSTIKENHVTTQGIKAIPDIFSHFYRYGYYTSDDGLYRPLAVTVFAVEWWVSPDNPSLAHFVNIFLYAFTGWTLFVTLKKLLKNYNIVLPFIIVLLFITHPIHTEVVANIKSLDEILGFLFSFAAVNMLCGYMEEKSINKLVAGIFLFFAALLSKESAIIMLAGFPLIFLYFKNDKKREIIISTVGIAGVTILFLFIRWFVLSKSTHSEPADGLFNPLLAARDSLNKFTNEVRMLGYYIKLLIYPSPLIYDYSYNQMPIADTFNILSVFSLFIYIGLLIYGVKGFINRQILAFGILFYLIAISVFSNIVFPLGVAMAERFVYFASFGFCFCLGVLLVKWTKTQIQPMSYSSLPLF